MLERSTPSSPASTCGLTLTAAVRPPQLHGGAGRRRTVRLVVERAGRPQQVVVADLGLAAEAGGQGLAQQFVLRR